MVEGIHGWHAPRQGEEFTRNSYQRPSHTEGGTTVITVTQKKTQKFLMRAKRVHAISFLRMEAVDGCGAAAAAAH